MHVREKWNAVQRNDSASDGKFYYAVTSTRIFCRPSCPSRPPLQENVVFFDTAEAAQSAGYRPCKRCRPDLPIHQPSLALAGEVKAAIDALFADRKALLEALAQLGLSRRRMIELFANQYGRTPGEYANERRVEAAKEQLRNEDTAILEIALSLGFESLSAFYAFFKKHTGLAPGDYRRNSRKDEGEKSHFAYDTPLGKISIGVKNHRIAALQFADRLEEGGRYAPSDASDRAARQLEEYFAGRRKAFQLPLAAAGTPFQQSVWSALREIPYGETRSYKQVAGMIGKPNASRAVGMANNKNPLLILIPCHRVVGADGSLVGYAASLDIKRQLLALEKKNAAHGNEEEPEHVL